MVDVERCVEGGAHTLDFISSVQRLLGVAHELGVDNRDVPGDAERGGEVLARLNDAADDAEGEGARR